MTIKRSQRALLQECIQRQAPDLEPLAEKVGQMPLSEAEREELRGAVAAELIETGLDSAGGHNKRGVVLEDLIDALGHV